jgi:hypothetical protein
MVTFLSTFCPLCPNKQDLFTSSFPPCFASILAFLPSLCPLYPSKSVLVNHPNSIHCVQSKKGLPLNSHSAHCVRVNRTFLLSSCPLCLASILALLPSSCSLCSSKSALIHHPSFYPLCPIENDCLFISILPTVPQ